VPFPAHLLETYNPLVERLNNLDQKRLLRECNEQASVVAKLQKWQSGYQDRQ
jgi:hypothetical protein